MQNSVIDTQFNDSRNFSSDIYGDFEYNITDKLTVDVSLRLTHDYVEGSLEVPLNNAVTISDTGVVQGRLIGLLTGAYPNNVSFASPQKRTIHKNFISLTGGLALDYKVASNINFFGSVAKGRRPQAINYFNNDFRLTEDETVWNYELGVKSFLFNNTLSFNSSVYLLKFNNFNTPVSDSEEGQQGQVNFNQDDTGKATSLGWEFDFSLFLNNETTIFRNYNYVDATVDDEDVNGNRSQYAGNRIRLTPKHAVTIGVDWNKEFSKDWELFIRPNYTHKSDIYFTAANDERLQQTEYGLFNFRTGVVFNKKYALDFFMNNVLDVDYINDAGNSGNNFGIPTTLAGAPRIFGWRLSATF